MGYKSRIHMGVYGIGCRSLLVRALVEPDLDTLLWAAIAAVVAMRNRLSRFYSVLLMFV